MLRSLLLLLIVFSSTKAAAEAPIEIDEPTLLARLAQDPRLGAIAAALDEAQAEVLAASRWPNPSVGYERERVGTAGGKDELRLSFPVELSGRRGARRAAAGAEVRAVTAEGQAARWSLTLQALRAFRAAQYQRARHRLLLDERAALAAAVEIVRKRSAAGATSGYDVQRIELELAGYDDELAAAAAELELARAELGHRLASPTGVDAAGAFALPAAPADPALDEAARAQRPEARAARARQEAAHALERSAARAWIPSLLLSGGAVRAEAGAPGDEDWGYVAGVALELPLLDRGQAERARAKAAVRRADSTRQLLDSTAPLALQSRRAALVDLRARAVTLEQAQAARLPQLLRSAEAAYREGGGNIVELVDAYRTARDVRLRALALTRDAHLAQLDYWSALGSRP